MVISNFIVPRIAHRRRHHFKSLRCRNRPYLLFHSHCTSNSPHSSEQPTTSKLRILRKGQFLNPQTIGETQCMATTIRLDEATDDRLVEECREKANLEDCAPPEWTSAPNNVRVDPPKDTRAVVVDVRDGQGAIRIVTSTNQHVDGVGPAKEGGNMVIIPWDERWWYYAIGKVRVGHIRLKS